MVWAGAIRKLGCSSLFDEPRKDGASSHASPQRVEDTIVLERFGRGWYGATYSVYNLAVLRLVQSIPDTAPAVLVIAPPVSIPKKILRLDVTRLEM
jgi:hypothetical protein